MRRYALTPVEATCPVCNCGQAVRLYSVSVAQAAQHFVLREADPQRHAQLRANIEALWRQPDCHVLRCRRCGFGFAHPFVAGDEGFYSLVYSAATYPAGRWEHRATEQALRDLGRQDFRLLEVGAGEGAFLRRIAPALTPAANVVCTELSGAGRQALRAQGFHCLAVDIRDLDHAHYRARFEVICLFQVLEHLDRLDALFQSLTALAGPEALLFVSTPNPRRVEYHELNGALLDMPPHHIGRWSRNALETLGQRYGWALARHVIDPTDGFLARASNFLIYRFQRASHEPRSLANWLRRSPHRPLRRLTQLIGVALYGAAALPDATGLRAPRLGGTQWACLKRMG
jgi:SAM-dependent methyltransferase